MGDLRLAVRLLLKDAAFTATAVLTLTVCIGANVALFAIVHSVLLKPLPLPGADRIVAMGNAYPGAGAVNPGSSSVPDHFDRRRDMDVFDSRPLAVVAILACDGLWGIISAHLSEGGWLIRSLP